MLSANLKDRITYTVSQLIRGWLRLGGRRFHNAVVRSLPEISLNRQKDNIRIDVPNEIEPDLEDEVLFQRIFESFKKMKEDQISIDPLFLPSSEWQRQLNVSFSPLARSLETENVEPLSYFLTNFGVWPEYIGIESGSLLRRAAAHPSTRQQLLHNFELHFNWWRDCEGWDRSLESISYPRFGNQSGMSVDSCFLGLGSMGNDYFAKTIASRISADAPVILEVGGGYGKLFYFLNRALGSNFRQYIDIDLPEVLCCCAYYLGKCFPDSKMVLYGEYDTNAAELPDGDILLLPGWEMKKLKTGFADIFLNKNSLGEMEADAATYFVREGCRCSRSFWHMNHESFKYQFDNGRCSLVNREYPIPEEWQLISRVPDALNAMVTHGATTEIYEYFYVSGEQKSIQVALRSTQRDC